MSQGVVAAGHPLTAEVGADILRQGGNAVDAAVASALTSFAVESPLTGLGAGGFMMVHLASGESRLLDFFIQVPGRGADLGARAELIPISVDFEGALQTFNIGAASCGVYGTPMGLWEAARRYGTISIAELVRPAIDYAYAGSEVNQIQAFIFRILEPVLTHFEETREVYAPQGRMLRVGEKFRFPALAEELDRYASEGPEPYYRGEVAAQIAEWVCAHGGVITGDDLASYDVVDREPIRTSYRGYEVLTNPPPSSGGILIAYALSMLERVSDSPTAKEIALAMQEANAARTEEFHTGLYDAGYLGHFLSEQPIAAGAESVSKRSSSLGSTTHISVVDGDGNCAAVTCSNGTGSGVLVPGTGIHINNMLGEEDLNPLGFHSVDHGSRLTSMMCPAVVLQEGQTRIAVGSAGSNRIRSAILQTVVNILDRDMDVADAVNAGRIHFEDGEFDAEPGVDPDVLDQLEAGGYAVRRWDGLNLFFGGAQVCTRDPLSGQLAGAGDPRRGGACVVI